MAGRPAHAAACRATVDGRRGRVTLRPRHLHLTEVIARSAADSVVVRGWLLAWRSDGAFTGHADQVGKPAAQVSVAAELRLFLKPAHRAGPVWVTCDGVSSLGHVVQSLGIPLTEVGLLAVNGHPVPPRYRPSGGDVVDVAAVGRPQAVPVHRFLLDVHLGALARRLRLVGVDTAYANDASDDALIAQANAQRRILLTQDRGLLRRRALWLGGYVYGARPDDQLADALARFNPPLAPWTRCPACNGPLSPIPKAEAQPLLQPATRRTYQTFSRCSNCGQVYWRGAHAKRLEALIATAQRARPGGHPSPTE